jgi:hypothetical protein
MMGGVRGLLTRVGRSAEQTDELEEAPELTLVGDDEEEEVGEGWKGGQYDASMLSGEDENVTVSVEGGRRVASESGGESVWERGGVVSHHEKGRWASYKGQDRDEKREEQGASCHPHTVAVGTASLAVSGVSFSSANG